MFSTHLIRAALAAAIAIAPLGATQADQALAFGSADDLPRFVLDRVELPAGQTGAGGARAHVVQHKKEARK